MTGLLDVGCFPNGVDSMAVWVAAAFAGATFSSEARPDIARWKYMKLLTNLGNAVEAACGPAARTGSLAARVRDEGIACFRAAGIDFASDAEDAARRGDLLQIGSIGDRPRGGGSSWQSLRRQSGSIETDYLNGEIVLLGRLHGVPTPANALVQQAAGEAAYLKQEPGSVREAELLARLDSA